MADTGIGTSPAIVATQLEEIEILGPLWYQDCVAVTSSDILSQAMMCVQTEFLGRRVFYHSDLNA